MGIHGTATNLPDGNVEVLLDTDDMKVVSAYAQALMENPARKTFFGRIDDIDVSDYSGRMYGDYVF